VAPPVTVGLRPGREPAPFRGDHGAEAGGGGAEGLAGPVGADPFGLRRARPGRRDRVVSRHRLRAIFVHELRLRWHDPVPMALLLLGPLLSFTFTRPMFEVMVAAQGHSAEAGGAYAVPAVTLTFSLFLVGYTGLTFFAEYSWGTLARLRASSSTPLELVIGKGAPTFLLGITQLALMAAVHRSALHEAAGDRVLLLVPLGVAWAACMTSIGLLLVAFARSVHQLSSTASVLAIICAGLGGTLAPIALLPSWAQTISPATPTYWAMRAFSDVLLEGATAGSVVLPTVVLLTMSAAAFVLALVRFDTAEVKRAWR
jgi:ABC-2 type transport system permease protein